METRLQTIADLAPTGSPAAVSALLKLQRAQRNRVEHQARCIRCAKLTTAAVRALLEDEAMRIARLECAERHGEVA